MIPKEAIEAAAKAMVALAGYDWNNMDAPGDVVADFKEQSMAQAESILEAAAPHIRAQALEDAAAEVDEGVPAYGQGEYADWLRAQAAAERGTHGNH